MRKGERYLQELSRSYRYSFKISRCTSYQFRPYSILYMLWQHKLNKKSPPSWTSQETGMRCRAILPLSCRELARFRSSRVVTLEDKKMSSTHLLSTRRVSSCNGPLPNAPYFSFFVVAEMSFGAACISSVLRLLFVVYFIFSAK